MLLSDFLIHATRVVYFLLGVASLLELARRRDQPRLDVALLFGGLAYVVAVQEVITVYNVRPDWLVKSIQLVVLAHSYLLLRVMANLRPMPRWLMRAAAVGMLLAWAIWLAFVAPPLPWSLPTIAYMVAVDAYAVVSLVRGALTTRGVTRRRLQFGALGAGLLAAVLALAAIEGLWPAMVPGSAYLVQVLAVLSGLAFYVGFAAPRRVRRWWQLDELEDFLNASQGAPADEPVPAALGRLCQSALRAVGGQSAFTLSYDAPRASGSVIAATDPRLAQWWAEHWPQGWNQPGLLPAPAPLATPAAGRQPASEAGPAHTVMLVPIGAGRPRDNLLVVILAHRPLFPNDDQMLLNLMCRQSALVLEQKALIGQLREQNQDLLKANQELEAFAYSVSHDLRTPLRHIQGFAELLRDGAAPAGDGAGASLPSATAPAADLRAGYLDRIISAAGRMAHMIDVFLAFSRLGHSELAVTRVPLGALVAQVKDEVAPEAGARQVVWTIGPLPEVLGDPMLLRQAWTNLLSNALKYTRPRALARIEVGAMPAQPGQALLYVRDNGVGFDPDYAPQLFTMFHRLHHAADFEGDGIGLAVVRRIVQRHNGRVWAEGALEGGATFYLELPVPAGATVDMAPAAAAAIN